MGWQRLMAAVAGAAATVVILAGPAGATWSIVGVDSETGEAGVAIASCVDIDGLFDLDSPLPLVALEPGVGAGVSQAELNEDAAPEMARLLAEGAGPAEIIAAVSNPDFDRDPQVRQHAVVTVDGTTAAFTGTETLDVALDRQAPGISAQGNILVGDAVILDAVAAFDEAGDMPLAERLVAALYAGSQRGGDSRCGQQTALFASVVVAGPADDPDSPATLSTVTAEGESNPVVALAQQFGITIDPTDLTPAGPAISDGGESPGGGRLGPTVLLAALAVAAVTAWLIGRRGTRLRSADRSSGSP